jgi:F-type H+-transporting ATPase subunit b
MLQIDQSLLIQIVNFLLLIFLLNIFLYRPIRRVMAQRSEKMGSLEQAIESAEKKSNENEEGIRENRLLARKDGYQTKEALKLEGLAEEKTILRASGSQVEEKISGAKVEIDGQTAAVRKALEEQVAVFSKELAEKILGRSVR